MSHSLYGIPLASNILDIKEIDSIKFFNTSFREYLGVYGEYIIGVYPFAITVNRAFGNDNRPISYYEFKMQGVRSSQHHIDFIKNEISFDPCDVYEKISGIKIHNGEDDSHKNILTEKRAEIKFFEAEILSQIRDYKLKIILEI